jgi:VWFA-related protein
MKSAAFVFLVLLAGLAGSARTPPQQPPQQQPPVFKSRTDVVPLTVTVVDEKGVPVKDLKASDFTVTENRKVREIVNFFPTELAPLPVPAGDAVPARAPAPGNGLAPPTRRTFLIVLGYGRIEFPTNALEGAIELVNRMLPQDAVAVMAFHRTTAFTTDHQRIVQILERYRKDHEKIVLDINNYRFMARAPVIAGGRAGTSAPPGSAPIPDKIIKRIDEIFLGPSASGNASPGSPFLRDTSDMLIGMDRVTPVVEKPGQHQETFDSITKELRDNGESFRDEVLLSTKLKFYAGVEYLRRIDGEKQIVFFSGLEGGGTLAGSPYRAAGRGATAIRAPAGRYEAALNAASGADANGMARDIDEASVLAERASDARVVVNLIATNGTTRTGGGDPTGRHITELTGGYYTSLEMAPKAVARVDEMTRFSYLLGYTPSDPALDGRFRDVDVKVNRPGVTVRFRHGYFAADEPPPLELEALMKRARIETALAFDQESKDIPVQVTVSPPTRMGVQSQTRVEIVIGAAPLALTLTDGVRSGQLEVQVYCGDAKQKVIGDAGDHFDLTADEATYQQWLQFGIRKFIRVPTDAPPQYVKVVVYDYGSDRVGSAMVTIK